MVAHSSFSLPLQHSFELGILKLSIFFQFNLPVSYCFLFGYLLDFAKFAFGILLDFAKFAFGILLDFAKFAFGILLDFAKFACDILFA